jgi:hypothetical protein
MVWGGPQKDSWMEGGLINDPGAGGGPWSLRPSMEDARFRGVTKAYNAIH